MEARTHPRQEQRLAALRRLEILDTPREPEFDDVVALVSALCDAPVAVVNLIDADRQWFKAEVGLGVRSTPLDSSLCSHVILENEFVEIPDTLADLRMADNPLCTADGGFRFYAGSLLKTDDGLPIGTLCVLDTKPRTLTPIQRDAIKVLAQRVMRELEHRQAMRQQITLRKEIDHRVKNSLGMVGAILHLQASSATSPEVRDALGAVRSRLTALEAFHEELHQETTDELVQLDSIIARTVAKLAPLLPPALAFDISLPALSLPSDQANALTLIVNEFATNTVKHGLGADGHGTIRIVGEQRKDRLHLSISDNGAGDERTLTALKERQGLGVRVVETLARSAGSVAMWSACNPGLRLDLDLPLKP